MVKNKKVNTIDIGVAVKNPENECNDVHCAFHGGMKVHGREFTAVVIKANAQKTAVVGWERLFYLPKYQRYEKRRSKLQVHNPSCINAKAGDKVKVIESRPISKTKNFVIIERQE
jgi:small subunit ribosomal protein S17